MDFQKRELRFGLSDRSQFNEDAVKQALQAQGFAGVALRAGPS
jgi:hypothetical protein